MTMLHLGNDTNMSSLDKYDKEQLQPNAIDLRVKEITKITDTVFEISEDKKVHRKTEAVKLNEEGYWILEPGSYEIIFEGKIKLEDTTTKSRWKEYNEGDIIDDREACLYEEFKPKQR